MASTRYGRIYHGNHHHNNIKFPSPKDREKFAETFKKYHESHDHDGEVPRFEFIKASNLKSYERGAEDFEKITIDGYPWHEIHKYHAREDADTYTHYRPPTCCVSPIIVLKREFIDSGTLERHELSAIFGGMPADDFQHLVKSVEQDGFMDPLIRMHEGKILDGWHRYRAALELNVVRKLRFMSWDEEKEGKAVAFVSARNIERRHLSAGQRAQIVVSLNERFGWGGDRSKETNDHLKTQDELAQQANVSKKSIQRAVQVEQAGESEAVIAGVKSATQVIAEKTVKELWEEVTAEMKAWKRRSGEEIGRVSKTMLITSLRARLMSDENGAATIEELKLLLELMRTNSRSFVLRVKQTLTGEEPDEILSQTNPYTDDFIYTDEKLVNSLIPSFKAQLTSEPHNSNNAVEKLQMIRQELIRRGHSVDEMMNVELKQPEPEEKMPEVKQAHDTDDSESKSASAAEEREASILLKKKKKILKTMWDLRKQAAVDYMGDADNDLNNYLTLVELEKGFAKSHKFMADVFRSGMQRISVPGGFSTYVERALESGVSLEELQKEEQAVRTYAYDILIWNRQEWILELIEQKQAKQSEKKAEKTVLSKDEPDTIETLLEKVTAEMEVWKQRHTTHVTNLKHVTTAHVIEAYRYCYGDRNREGEATAEELAAILESLRQGHMPLILGAEQAWRNSQNSEQIEAEPDEVASLWEQVRARIPKWKEKYEKSGYKENNLIQGASEVNLIDALRIYRETEEEGEATVEELKDLLDLMKSNSYPFARRLRKMLSECEAAGTDSTEDTSLNDLDLPALEELFEGLLETVGQVEHGAMRDDLSVSVYEVFYPDENGYDVSNREMLSILIDCAHSLITQSN